jgi:hypothetical protein
MLASRVVRNEWILALWYRVNDGGILKELARGNSAEGQTSLFWLAYRKAFGVNRGVVTIAYHG